MNAVGFGVSLRLIVLLGLGGGLGVPLGIPPAPEDPLLARVAPEECLFYTSWAGMAEPDPNSTNQTEQLLAEPEVQQMIAELKQRFVAAVREQAGRNGPQAGPMVDDAVKWVEVLLTHPTVAFVSSVKVSPQGPDIRGGILVNVGGEVDELKAALEKYGQVFLQGNAQSVEIAGDQYAQIKPGPQAPMITWGIKGKYLIVGVGDGAVDAILKDARTPAPAWMTKLRGQLPVDRVATVTHINLKAILKAAESLPGANRIQPALAAAGLDNVVSLSSVTGLDKEGCVSRTLLAVDGPAGGLLTLVSDKPLAPNDLAPIPADATIALAGRLDADAALQTILSVVEKFEPSARADVMTKLGRIEQMLGFSVRDDVLKSLGDTWCLYNSPSEGGLVITGLTAVIQVKDRQRLAGVQEKMLAFAKTVERRDEGSSARPDPRIERFEFAGQTVYFVNARDKDFPLAPAWCLTDKELVVAAFPQNIKSYLLRDTGRPSLASVPEVAAQLQASQGPSGFSYVDTRRIFELVYPFVPMIAQMAMSEMQRQGIDVNVSILPSARAIGKHLRGGVATVRRTEAGIELTSRQTLPGGSLGTAAPVAISMLLPAVQSARGAARRSMSMNNLKQIALAMHMYNDAHGTFPPAYSSDAAGKPLLSWRVLILPYIGQQGLYEQFHLDEPWDSAHNSQLIQKMPPVYRPPEGGPGTSVTNYLTVRGPATAFPGKEGIAMSKITDGTSSTAMVVEVNPQSSVTWTKPDDYEYDASNPAAGLIGARPGGFNAAFCDGHVEFIPDQISPDTLKAMFTRDGGEAIDRNR